MMTGIDEPVGDGVGVAPNGVLVGLGVGEGVAVGAGVGDADGVDDGAGVADGGALDEAVTLAVGLGDGVSVAVTVGLAVGEGVGVAEGELAGVATRDVALVVLFVLKPPGVPGTIPPPEQATNDVAARTAPAIVMRVRVIVPTRRSSLHRRCK